MKNFNPIKIGLTDEMDTEFRRVTMLTNVVYILLLFLLTVYLAYYLPDYLKLERLTLKTAVPWLAWGSVAAGLTLNALRKHTLSKVLFISSWILFINIIPTVLGNVKPINFFLYPFYCIATSVIIHIIFSHAREKVLYYLFTSLVWLLTVFSYEFIMYFNPDQNVTTIFPNGFFPLRIVVVMMAVFFNAAIMYLIRVNHDFYDALQRKNDTISRQYEELKTQRKDLEELKLKLEEKVKARTQLLLEQNTKLREYTFFNSHILRAPVSRIRGLLYLLSVETPEEEERRVRMLLAESMVELDQAIKSINDKLQAAELLEEFH